MTDRWKNILIGAFVLAAFSIGVALLLFLKPTIGDGKKTLKVRFANISGLNKGTRVTYAGKPIGQVMRIEEIPNAREIADNSGRVFYYQLFLRIDSKISVYTTDEIAICTYGLMGEKSIAILPKMFPEGQMPQLVEDQIIYANSVDPFESTFTQIGRVADKAQRSLDRVDDWIRQNTPQLTKAVSNISSAAESIQSVMATVQDQRLVASVKDSLDLASETMRQAQDVKLLSHLSSLVSDLNEAVIAFNTDGAKALANLNELSHEIVAGQGTLGRLFVGDDFYLRMNSIMSKSETLMNDINHYGLLFQYNKQWQRTRTRKANLMSALSSPQEFKSYFEGEIDEISTSLGRISQLLERADQDAERDKILNNDAFKKDFAVLLRQVKALNDAVKLFNQDLVSKTESDEDR